MSFSRLLSSIDAVKELQGETGTEYDGLYQSTLEAACDAIYDATDVEFIGITDPATPVKRSFLIDHTDVEDHEVRVCPLYELTGSTVLELRNPADDSVVATIANARVDANPSVRKAWEPITHLRFRDPVLVAGYYLDVTGKWGFPTVPNEVVRFAEVLTVAWFSRDVAKWSSTFSTMEGRIEVPDTIPATIRRGLKRFAPYYSERGVR